LWLVSSSSCALSIWLLIASLSSDVVVGVFCGVQENKPIVLTKQSVDGIQLQGGTILGTSRGGANMK
jgi:6-phosphofructokinase